LALEVVDSDLLLRRKQKWLRDSVLFAVFNLTTFCFLLFSIGGAGTFFGDLVFALLSGFVAFEPAR
jgi:hypothetical protein